MKSPLSDGSFIPVIRRLETEVYSWKLDLKKWVNGSQFLTIKYGMIDANKILAQLSQLPENWDSYGAPPPNAESVRASSEALKNLAENQILPTAIVASAEGGVSIYFMRGERTAYLESDNEGTQTLVLYGQQTPTEVLGVDSDIPGAHIGARLLEYLG